MTEDDRRWKQQMSRHLLGVTGRVEQLETEVEHLIAELAQILAAHEARLEGGEAARDAADRFLQQLTVDFVRDAIARGPHRGEGPSLFDVPVDEEEDKPDADDA